MWDFKLYKCGSTEGTRLCPVILGLLRKWRKKEMIQAIWCNIFYFYPLKFTGFIVVKKTYAKATITIENMFLSDFG